MTRSVQLHVPKAMARMVTSRLSENNLAHRICATELMGGKEVHINFLCIDKHLSPILKNLENTGIGHDFGSVNIFALESTVPTLKNPLSEEYDNLKKKRKYNVSDRRTVREIEENIDAGLHFTFDFILLVLVAGIISTVGLLSDSAVTVVASMLVSPLMGPIVGIAYGIAVKNYDMVRIGFRNELFGLLLCYTFGSLAGLVAVFFFEPLGSPSLTRLTGNAPLESEQMSSRGDVINLLGGFWNAVPSGIGVALATTNAGISALVGVAISAALLPPLVNSAILISMGTVYELAGVQHDDLVDEEHSFIDQGLISLGLFFINFCTIVLFAVLTFRLKGVTRENRELAGEHSGRGVHVKGGLSISSRESERDREGRVSPVASFVQKVGEKFKVGSRAKGSSDGNSGRSLPPPPLPLPTERAVAPYTGGGSFDRFVKKGLEPLSPIDVL